MKPTLKQREDFEVWRIDMLKAHNGRISELESELDDVVKERERLESMTFEDHYFSHLAEQGSER